MIHGPGIRTLPEKKEELKEDTLGDEAKDEGDAKGMTSR